MIEEIDTNSNFANKDLPDGRHKVRITAFRKYGNLYIFPITYDGGKEAELTFFGNQMGDFLKELGCPETAKKGIYAFDSDKVIGAELSLTIYHEADKKDPNKIYQRSKDFKEELKF